MQSIRPLWIVGGVTLLLAIVLLLLPPTLQRLSFYLIILVGLVVAILRFTPISSQDIQASLTDRQTLIKISAGIAVILIALAGWFYQPEYIVRFYGFYLFVLSLPFLWMARHLFAFDTPTNDTPHHNKLIFRPIAIIVALVAFAMLMGINIPDEMKGDIHLTLGLFKVPTHIQMGLLGIGIGGLIVGFGANLLPYGFQFKRHHLLLIVLIGLGGAIRLYNLEYTLHLFVDEFFFMNDVIEIRDSITNMYFPRQGSSSDVYPFFQSIFVTLLGPSLTSLRLASPIISMVGLLVVYAFACQLFSVRVALISVLLVAVMPVYIQFGRIGMYMIADPIFGMLGFVYLMRGMRSGYMGDFALAGIMFGMSHYFYEGGRLFFTAFLVCWLIWMTLFGRRDPLFKLPNLRESFALIFCFAMVIVPIYHTRLQYDFVMTERLNATRTPDFLLTDRISEFLLSNEIGYLGSPLHRYVHDVARDNFFRSDFAYILPILVPFFLLGFGLLLFKLHRTQGALLIWWTIGVAIGNTLITDFLSAPSPRHIVVYAVLMVITAFGIDRLWQLLDTHLRIRRWIISALMIIYLGYVSVFQVDHYFNATVPYYYERVHGTVLSRGIVRPAFDDMILRAVELPDNTTLHVFTTTLFPVTHHREVPRFFQRSREDLRIIPQDVTELDRLYFVALPRDKDHVFAFARRHQEIALGWIQQFFVVTQVEGSPYGISEDAEMLFAYAPLSANPTPEPVDMPFERAPNAKP